MPTSLSTASPATTADLGLRGHRFAPLRYADMDEAQRRMTDSVLGGQRGSMQGPYNVLLRSPEVGQLAQQFGAHTRFHSSLPLRLNEMAILLVARAWRCEFVWWAHRRIALDSGLAPALVETLLTDAEPGELPPQEAAVHGFCRELLATRRVGDAAYARLLAQFGETGAVDLMATMGYYQLVCMLLNVDQYPLPDGEAANFPAADR